MKEQEINQFRGQLFVHCDMSLISNYLNYDFKLYSAKINNSLI